MSVWNANDSAMARTMKLGALICVALTGIFALIRLTPLTITAAMFSYHLLMRLAVGFALDRTLNNRVDYRRGWFQLRSFETALYERLRVNQWKSSMPTYDPDVFDRRQHSWEEIAQAMCQAELVHEINVVLSFLPVLAAIWVGAVWVFVITSLLAAAFDLMFVIMQRYNRPRILRIVEMMKTRG